jgi:hypothetical protein
MPTERLHCRYRCLLLSTYTAATWRCYSTGTGQATAAAAHDATAYVQTVPTGLLR